MRNLLCSVALLAGIAVPAPAQQSFYSETPEYQQMLRELRTPAPSPAYMASGKRVEADRAVNVSVEQGGGALRLKTEQALYSVQQAEAIISIDDLSTKAHWSLQPSQGESCGSTAAIPAKATDAVRKGDVWTVSFHTACGDMRADFEVLRQGLARLTLLSSASPNKGAFELRVSGAGPFFGLGERFRQAELVDTTMDARPQDRFGEPGHNWTYVGVPFVYTASGLGMYLDTTFDTKFHFDEAASAFEIKLAASPVSIYLFTEATPKAVLTSYTSVTGRPENPPLWTFGPWITALGGSGDVLEQAWRLRAEGIPASALWVYDQNDEPSNIGWPFWFASYYGDSRTYVDALHGQGYKVLSYVHPYVRQQMTPYTTESPQYEKGLSQHFLAMGANGKPAGPRFEQVQTGNVDFTNPKAVDWWQGMMTSAVRDQGFDGWMEDFGEWVRDTDKFAAGDGRTISAVYPLLYHKVTTQIVHALNPDVVSFSRSGSPGSQAFSPVLWGADQAANWSRDYGLPSVVTAGITAGMSGFSNWGPDILSTGSSRELWDRWVEFGALTPVMRDHPWDKPKHAIDLWSDTDATALFRRYAQLHSSLLPYFATFAEEAHRTGIPIMRHTVLEYPDDPHSATAEYQYLLGSDLLVAPVVQPASERTLYLPKGEWVNFWSGENLMGGQEVTVVAGAEEIPIMVRAGTVLPFKAETEAATWDWSDPQLLSGSLIWRAYLSSGLHADSTFSLPDGTSARLQQQGETLALTGTSKAIRDYEIILHTAEMPRDLRMNGAPFVSFTKGKAGQRATQWYWNSARAELHAVFRAGDFRLEMKGVSLSPYQQ